MRIKICCIQSIEEMELAVRCGADVIGLVSAMPSGPGPIAEGRIAEISAATPRGIETFLLTSLVRASDIIAQHHRCGTAAIQLTDRVLPPEFPLLRAELPRVKLVQVIHVADVSAELEAARAMGLADELLLDSGRPLAAVKELGGTGRTHDWSVSRRIVAASRVPVWLAGGLNAGNAAAAIQAVWPHGLDVCSGVRLGGRLDEQRLKAFIDATTNAISNE
jgi:phosphoribosylanthranilate isomerase